MIRQKFLGLVFLLGFLPLFSFADSPLTSTYWADLFEQHKIIRYAQAHPTLTRKTAKFLLNDKKPLELKIAVINAMSWDTDGKQNAILLKPFLVKKYKFDSEEPDHDQVSGEDLICLAYLKALDNYFDVKEAFELANLAVNKIPKSRAAHIIFALIQAQDFMSGNWCDVYRVVQQATEDPGMENDFGQEAIEKIMEYIVLYSDDC